MVLWGTQIFPEAHTLLSVDRDGVAALLEALASYRLPQHTHIQTLNISTLITQL